MNTATPTATGSDCLAELRNGGFSWDGIVGVSPGGGGAGQLSTTIDKNEDNHAQPPKPLCSSNPSTPRPLLARGSRRPRTKRCRRSAFSPRPLPPLLFEPKNSPTCRLIKQQRKKLAQLYPPSSDHMEKKSGNCLTKCTHCGVTDTPQWRAGPLGPRTLCNACGVRYKSGRLLPEYRPAASPYFSPNLHSNSHKKVLEMRNKPVQGHYTYPEKVEHFENDSVRECFNDDDAVTKVPVACKLEEDVSNTVGSKSPDNVLQRIYDDEDEEGLYKYFLDETEANNPMELIPNIDPMYGLDISEYYLGDHSLDFTF